MSDPTPNPSPNPAPTPPAPPAPQIAWAPDITDAELVGHVQNKQYGSAADVIRAHRDLEKLLGADRAGRTFTLPKDDADAEGWKAVAAKLGRPESPEGYELPVPQGADATFAKEAAKWFHEAGVPKRTAGKLAEQWNAYMTAQATAANTAEKEALAREHADLVKDWGDGPAAVMQREIAKRAAVKLGLDEGSIDALEKVVGYSKVMKTFAKIGELIGEHKAVGLDSVAGFNALTPQQAQSRKQQLMSDPAWVAKAMKPASAEWAELTRLDGIIAEHMQRAAA